MRLQKFLASLFVATGAAVPTFADLPCPLVPAPPVAITAAAFLEGILGVLVQNGISLLFAGAVAVVGVPWLMAGLAMGLLQLLHRKP